MEKTITLNINGEPIRFNLTADAHERLINEMQPTNKVAPMHNFLTRTVDKDSKETLKPFLEDPSSVMIIAERLVENFVPKLKITVGE